MFDGETCIVADVVFKQPKEYQQFEDGKRIIDMFRYFQDDKDIISIIVPYDANENEENEIIIDFDAEEFLQKLIKVLLNS